MILQNPSILHILPLAFAHRCSVTKSLEAHQSFDSEHCLKVLLPLHLQGKALRDKKATFEALGWISTCQYMLAHCQTLEHKYIYNIIYIYMHIYIYTLSRIDEYVPTKFLPRSCNLLQAHSLQARPPTSDNTPLEFAREAIPFMMCQELAMPTITPLTELQKKKTTHCSRQSRLPSHPKPKKWRIWIRRPAGVLCGCSCDTSCDNFSFTYI